MTSYLRGFELRFSLRTTLVLAAVIVALFAFYFHGTFDRALSPVGLNFNECDRNGYGATFCGTELDHYRDRLARLHVR
jgi:hypothetical protein